MFWGALRARALPPCGVCTESGTCTHARTPHLPRPPARPRSAFAGEPGAERRGACASPSTELGHRAPPGAWSPWPSGQHPATARAPASCAASSRFCGPLALSLTSHAATDPRPRSSQHCPARPRLQLGSQRVSGHLPRARPLAAAHLPQGGGRGGAGRWMAGVGGGMLSPVGGKNRTGTLAPVLTPPLALHLDSLTRLFSSHCSLV